MKHRARRGFRLSDLNRAPAYVAVIPMIAVFVTATSFLLDRSLPIVAVAAVCLAILMFIRPRYAVIAMIVFWAGSLAIPLQNIHLGPLRITPGDLCFLIGVAGVVWQRIQGREERRALGRPRFTVPIVVFSLATLWGLVVAAAAGNSMGVGFHAALNFLPLLSYFLLRHVYAGRSRTLFADLVVTTGILSMVTIVAILVGFEPLIGRSQNLIHTRGMSFDALRIDPPVLRLMCVTLMLALFVKVPGRGAFSWLRWPLIVAMLTVQGYSMTRTTWAPLLVVWLALPLLIVGLRAVPQIAVRAAVTTVVLAIGLGVASTGALGTTADAMAVRALSVTDDNIGADPSIQDRLVENQQAWAQIERSPIEGIGFPRPYGAYQYEYDVEQDLTRYIDKPFIHNTYLGLWMWMGILGPIAIVVLCLFVARAVWVIRHMRYRDASAPLAAAGGLFVLAASSLFQTNLMYRPAYFALAAGLACLDVWIAERALPRDEQLDADHPVLENPARTFSRPGLLPVGSSPSWSTPSSSRVVPGTTEGPSR